MFDCPCCGHVSCRLCLESPHALLMCAESEVKQIQEDCAKMMHAVAEAMTNAHIRRCKYVVLLFQWCS